MQKAVKSERPNVNNIPSLSHQNNLSTKISRKISIEKIHYYPNISSHIHHPHLIKQPFIASLIEAIIKRSTTNPQSIELCALSLRLYYGLLEGVLWRVEFKITNNQYICHLKHTLC